MIQFRCSACGTLMQTGDEHAGRQGKCANCGAAVRIPAAGVPTGTPAAAPAGPRMTPPAHGTLLPPVDEGRKGLATAALVCGIAGFVLPGIGLVGVVLGIVALLKVSNDPAAYGGKGLAITGLVTSLVALVLVVVTQLFYASVIDEVERTLGAGVADVPADAVAPELAPPATGEQSRLHRDERQLTSLCFLAGYREIYPLLLLLPQAQSVSAERPLLS